MACLRKIMLVGIVLVPLIAMLGACDRTITYTEEVNSPAGCFKCHSDVNTALVAAERQWDNSVHASGDNIDRNSSSCSGCHTSEGFVRRVQGESAMTIENPTVIHCFTCHAPHTNGNLMLRVTEPYTLENGASLDLHGGNICSSCHHSRQNVDTYVRQDTVGLSQHWGSHHGPQADMIEATNGYEYADYDYERSFGHRTSTEDGCLDCHMKTTLNNILGGHSFNMAVGETEEDEEQNTNGCNVKRCHDGGVDSFDHEDIQTDVEELVVELRALLQNAGLLDAEGEPVERDVLYRTELGDSAGAVWNYVIVEEDRSEGVHNPKYIKGLLQSSIDFLTAGGAQSVASSNERVRK